MSEAEYKENVQRLQVFEQNLQQLAMQRQQFQSQLIETENALKETQNSEKAYKIIGNIMVLLDKTHIQKDLKEKQDIINLRIKNIEKQEEQIRKQAKDLQQEVVKKLKK